MIDRTLIAFPFQYLIAFFFYVSIVSLKKKNKQFNAQSQAGSALITGLP